LFCTDYLCSVVSGEKPTVIAIVDDDELIRNALHGLMKAAGFRSLAFASGEEFLNSGEVDRVACLIADIRMPGMSGLELQSELRRIATKFLSFLSRHRAMRKCACKP